jgi:hypothetical protein
MVAEQACDGLNQLADSWVLDGSPMVTAWWKSIRSRFELTPTPGLELTINVAYGLSDLGARWEEKGRHDLAEGWRQKSDLIWRQAWGGEKARLQTSASTGKRGDVSP